MVMREKMKVVVEYVLIENFFINLIILKTTALITQEKGRLFWLSAFFGACLTVALPILRLNTVGHFLSQFGLFCIAVCLSFKFRTFKKFLQIYLCYFISACIYGGAVYFFERLIGQNFVMLVLVFVVILFVVLKFLIKRLYKKRAINNFCFDAEIVCNGKILKCKAFLDSGNLLVDPVTNQPVCLINFKMFSRLFEKVELEDILRKNINQNELKLAHYINLSTLNNTDKILVFQVDRLLLNNKTYENQILGLTFQSFEGAFGTDMILHNNFA